MADNTNDNTKIRHNFDVKILNTKKDGETETNKTSNIEGSYTIYKVLAIDCGVTSHEGDVKFFYTREFLINSIDKWNNIKCYEDHNWWPSVANLRGIFKNGVWSDEYNGIVGDLYLHNDSAKHIISLFEASKEFDEPVSALIALSAVFTVEFSDDDIKEQDDCVIIIPSVLNQVKSLDIVTDGATSANILELVANSSQIYDKYKGKTMKKSVTDSTNDTNSMNSTNTSIANDEGAAKVSSVKNKSVKKKKVAMSSASIWQKNNSIFEYLLVKNSYKHLTEEMISAIRKQHTSDTKLLSRNEVASILKIADNTAKQIINSNVNNGADFIPAGVERVDVTAEVTDVITERLYNTFAEPMARAVRDDPRSSPEARQKASEILTKLSKHNPYRSLRQMYLDMTGRHIDDGDVSVPFSDLRNCRKLPHVAKSVLSNTPKHAQIPNSEALIHNNDVNIGTFAVAFGNLMNRALLDMVPLTPFYEQIDQLVYKDYVNDFRARKAIRFGGFNTIFDVQERTAYQDLGTITEEVVSIEPSKRGGVVSISWEAITNDDLGYMRQLPMKIMRATMVKRYNFVFNDTGVGIFRNPTVYTGSAAFGATAVNASQSNDLGDGVVPTTAAIADLRYRMRKFFEQDTQRPQGVEPAYIMGVFENEDALNAALKDGVTTVTTPGVYAGSVSVPDLTNPFGWPNMAGRYGIKLLTNLTLNASAQSGQYPFIAFASPSVLAWYQLNFLGESDIPRTWISDIQNVGSYFWEDSIYLKVRDTYGGQVLDTRAIAGANLP